MTDIITVTGVVATEPRNRVTSAAVPITDFRLASNHRRFDRSKQEWVDNGTNWFTVSAFRQLALNSLVSLHKGERVVVTGRLKVREWTAGEKNGREVEIDADSIGHDLTFGTSTFTRSAVPGNHQQSEADAPVPSSSDAGAMEIGGDSEVFRAGVPADDGQENETASREFAAADANESTLSATPF